jgi:FlgD Ig-like domain
VLRRLIPLFAVIVTAFWLTAPPASAVGGGDPVFLAPDHLDPQVRSGFTGPVTIDFTNAAVASYEVAVVCNSVGYSWAADYSYDGTQDTMSWTIPAITGPADDCEASVDDIDTGGSNGYDEAYFTVAAPEIGFSRVKQAPATFYPRVRDGYLDTSTTHFHTDATGRVAIAVTNAKGHVVRRANLHRLSRGRQAWQWSGKLDDGTRAAVGTYHVNIYDAEFRKPAASTKVVVAAGTRVRKDSTGRAGHDYTSAATSGACHISQEFGTTTEELDCWGGRQALTRYRLTIPSSATHLRWHVEGHRASDDMCCHGSIKKSGKRLDRTHYQVQVRVTGWRAYDVRSAWVSYRYRARI